MKDDSQASTSLWMATADTPSQSGLKESIRTDICIIGAGIAGLTTAYLLAKEGRSVVVLDDGVSGDGMTAAPPPISPLRLIAPDSTKSRKSRVRRLSHSDLSNP